MEDLGDIMDILLGYEGYRIYYSYPQGLALGKDEYIRIGFFL